MPGNVREWCWNLSTLGRCIRGGAWNNNPYMFYITSQASPFDRAEENGFRCALYLNEDSIPKETFDKVEVNLSPDIDVEAANQFTEEEFERLKSIYYEYDRIDLETRVVSVTENEKGWVLEKVNFKTAYDNERMDCYLFLPTNTQPPYQSVIYGHSANALYQENSDNLEDFFEYKAFLEFIVENGRAVVFPIIKGTYGQRPDTPTNPPAGSHQKTTHLTRKIKDYRRCLDFLETRDDFNKETIAFYGMSWGPRLGTFLSAVDSRIKVNIFYAGGIEIYEETRPEVNMIYFLTQVKIPTLMINGKYDAIFPVGNITAMFKLLGTPDNDKNLVLFDSDHLAPVEGVMSETLAWLDLHFGQVDRSLEIRRL
jgi:dienelactone hydrolase